MPMEITLLSAYVLTWSLYGLTLYRRLRVNSVIAYPMHKTETLFWPLVSLICMPVFAYLSIDHADYGMLMAILSFAVASSLYWSVAYIYSSSRAV